MRSLSLVILTLGLSMSTLAVPACNHDCEWTLDCGPRTILGGAGGVAGSGGDVGGVGGTGGAGGQPLLLTTLAANGLTTCATDDNGDVWCWGNTFIRGNSASPLLLTGLTDALSVTVASTHSCGRLGNGTSWCWGDNDQGQLGSAAAGPSATQVDGLSGVTQLAAGGYHTCAIAQNDLLWCWGDNPLGQLGNDTMQGGPTPVAVNIGATTAIAGGDYHSCAATVAGDVLCWGANGSGQLGTGTMVDTSTPLTVPGATATQLAAGTFHTCALTPAGQAVCWGYNEVGQVGNGTQGNIVLMPTPIAPGTVFDSLSAAGGNTCGTSGGKVLCWGANEYGQVGTGEIGGDHNVPTEVHGIDNATSVAVGNAHACALTSEGEAWCWGENSFGQLGTGTMVASAIPAQVLFD